MDGQREVLVAVPRAPRELYTRALIAAAFDLEAVDPDVVKS